MGGGGGAYGDGGPLQGCLLYTSMYTALTIKDGSQEQTGRLTSNGDQTAVVWNSGALTLESGSIENTQEGTDGITIFNMGTVTVDGGELSGATLIYNTAYNGGQVKGNIVCNINGGTLHVSMWGICAMGPGFDSNGDVDNSKVTVNITGGTIIGTEGSEGDVYKRQAQHLHHMAPDGPPAHLVQPHLAALPPQRAGYEDRHAVQPGHPRPVAGVAVNLQGLKRTLQPVSYTHLFLTRGRNRYFWPFVGTTC